MPIPHASSRKPQRRVSVGAAGSPTSRQTALGAVAGVTALDVYCMRELSGNRRAAPVHIVTTITVDRPPEALYPFWRNVENLPRVMPYLRSVRATDDQRSHWSAAGGMEWDTEILEDRPNRWIAWRSVESSSVYNAGSVRFDRTSDGAGTTVTVELLYDPPPATIVVSVAKLLGRRAEVRADLEAFQRIIEADSAAGATPL